MPRLVPARVEVDKAALVEIQRRLSIAEGPDLPGAACRGMSDVMAPVTTKGAQVAREVCAGCPELAPCREWGLAQPTWVEGVWGGLTQVERGRINADRRRAERAERAEVAA